MLTPVGRKALEEHVRRVTAAIAVRAESAEDAPVAVHADDEWID
jgi:hypothetical protein